ncbi:AMP-binding protein [Stigmatella aurantiaca]|uniref:FadD11_2 n=1 Tax=Stigmatella aurantiaca (strain DW4/3-1) TaxID=378806 RepID=Q08Y82_STIAD|nr:AMP-binding protein [Stigmatella aurantiaca]ADO67954.1 Long-chain-fatty-acid-CoA ligase [Stigmatella aurantiaca DW4/3-1]EAU65435.1 FadD11_2 [Stigmatella aurantiaca DW4/3-1]
MAGIYSKFRETVSRRPGAVALRTPDRLWTYRELLSQTEHFRTQLEPQVGTGNTVGVVCSNDPMYVPLALALDALETTQVPFPVEFTERQRTWILHDAGCAHVAEASGSEVAVRPGPGPAKRWPGSRVVTYTSGSTGTPKGVVLPLGIEEALATALEKLSRHETEVYVSLLPISLYQEWVMAVYLPLTRGHTLVWAKELLPPLVTGTWDLPHYLHHLRQFGATYLVVPPQVVTDLASWVEQGKAGRNAAELLGPGFHLLGTGGAPGNVRAQRTLQEHGVAIYEGYGMSEAGAAVAVRMPGERLGTVGKPLSHRRLRIAEDGEILVAGEPLMMTYTNGERPIEDGWLHTGDLGQLDEDGALSIFGRKKRLLITSFARNIDPAWIEQVFRSSPLVERVKVSGDAQAQVTVDIHPKGNAPRELLQGELDRLSKELPRIIELRFNIIASSA